MTSAQGPNWSASPAKFDFSRQQTDVVEQVTAFRSGLLNFTGGDLPEQLKWEQASADYFRLFGAPIILGRAFSPEGDLPNGPQVALISEELWGRRFDRDPAHR